MHCETMKEFITIYKAIKTLEEQGYLGGTSADEKRKVLLNNIIERFVYLTKEI